MKEREMTCLNKRPFSPPYALSMKEIFSIFNKLSKENSKEGQRLLRKVTHPSNLIKTENLKGKPKSRREANQNGI